MQGSVQIIAACEMDASWIYPVWEIHNRVRCMELWSCSLGDL